MKPALMLITISLLSALLGSAPVFALNPSLDVSQYSHRGWTVRDGFFKGNIYAMAQTPDGYLWFGTEFGLVRFDGVRSTPWQPPAGQQLPNQNINSLLVTRDGTLWIGTFAGLAAWSGGKLTSYSLPGGLFVASLFEDREGTVWVSTLGDRGRLCAIRNGTAQCYGEDGSFGRAVWALYEDSSGTLWAAAQSGLWRMRPGPPRRHPTAMELIGLNKADDGRLLIAMHGAGLLKLVDDKLEPYPIRDVVHSNEVLRDRDVDANRLLRDRDGGLWVGTVERGLIHVHNGRTDVFRQSNGLSDDVILSLFEDREGDVWVASTGGLDRFRDLPVSTVSAKQGLSSDATQSVLAATDGSIWVGAHEGLTRWKNGQTTIFRRGSGLPDDDTQSLFQDNSGRIWGTFTGHGLAYFNGGRFVAGNAISDGQAHYVTGDGAGNLWVSERNGLLRPREGRLVEQIPWSALGRHQSAEVLLPGPEQGGVWLGFWVEGGVFYFKDGRIRGSYTAADGLGEGAVADLRLDRDGALWAATQGGLSRIKDDRMATLTSRNGLPCDTIHWSIEEDEDHSFWLYTACGLVRITRNDLEAWIADPKRKIEVTVWDTADGVRLRSAAASEYGPRVAKTTDGKLWFLTGEGVQIVDPHRLAVNKLPPPVHIEQIIADHKVYWQNLPGAAAANLRLPPRTRDLQIYYTALSFVSPQKIQFKYKLEGQDSDWREVVNDREVQYSNLAPRTYRFRVIASNNSGVWNEQGDTLEFTVAPAFYQTNWFRALCVVAVLLLLLAAYQLRVRQLHQQFDRTLEARVGERTRIARDLHDTLLQSFHGVLLYFQTGINLLPEHPAEAGTTDAKKTLEKAMDQAKHAIVEGREAIQGLRSSVVETNDLPLAMRTLGQEFAGKANSAALQVHVEGTPRDLHPILRDEVYRIAGEGIRNAFRHADAEQIEVEIHYDERRLRVRVRDNGKGIDSKLLSDGEPEGHFGLRGMQERAKLVGGTLAVWSERGVGTEVELSIPAARAYTRATDGQKASLTAKFFAKLSGRGTVKKT